MRVFNALIWFVALSACQQANPPRSAPNDVAAELERVASDPNAMWYHFKFEAEYQGKPFKLDQFVHCGLTEISGGSFGATPAITTRGMQPLTVGRPLPDGSYVIVRIPDLCLRYRNYRAGIDEGSGSRLPGWKSRGPLEVLPLVIWNDRRPNTTRVESYISPSYYSESGARFGRPRSTVSFMPVGYRPPNAIAILQQHSYTSYDPDPTINPATGKRWKGSVDRAPGEERFAAYAIIPINDLNAYAERFVTKPFKKIDEAGGIGFVRYAYWTSTGNDGPLAVQPDYHSPRDLDVCIRDFQMGVPDLSSMPPDPFDYGYVTQSERERKDEGQQAIEATRSGRTFISRADRRALLNERKRKCFNRLGATKSFDLRDGMLTTAGAVSGALVSLKLSGLGLKDYPAIRAAGAVSAEGYPKLSFDGGIVILNDDHIIVESKRDGRWYYIVTVPTIVRDYLEQ